MKEKTLLNILGILIGGLSVYLAVHWFGYRLLIVVFLALFGNNLSQLK